MGTNAVFVLSTSQEKIRHMSNHFAYVSKSTSFAERTDVNNHVYF